MNCWNYSGLCVFVRRDPRLTRQADIMLDWKRSSMRWFRSSTRGTFSFFSFYTDEDKDGQFENQDEERPRVLSLISLSLVTLVKRGWLIPKGKTFESTRVRVTFFRYLPCQYLYRERKISYGPFVFTDDNDEILKRKKKEKINKKRKENRKYQAKLTPITYRSFLSSSKKRYIIVNKSKRKIRLS